MNLRKEKTHCSYLNIHPHLILNSYRLDFRQWGK